MSHLSRRDALHAVGTTVAGLTAASAAAAPPAEKPRRKFLILTCDGGGVRGALTARIVQRVEQELQKATSGKVILRNRVDCFAGTSTGGLIALGLASGKTPEELVALYRDKGEAIFTRYAPSDLDLDEEAIYTPVTASLDGLERMLTAVLHALGKHIKSLRDVGLPPGWSKVGDQLFFVRYASSGMRKAFEDSFGDKARLTLANLTARVLVPTFQLGKPGEGWRPVVLHNFVRADAPDAPPDPDAKPGLNTTVLDAALCTCAAPAYFAPHKHPELGYCADGGVFANNPGVAALALALRAGRPLNEVRVLSVGTGSVTNYMKVPPWHFVHKDVGGSRCGLLAWLLPRRHEGIPPLPLLTALFEAGAAADAIYCQGLLGADGYRRIQVRYKKEIDLDDTAAIPDLIELADRYFETDVWKDDRAWLLKTLAD